MTWYVRIGIREIEGRGGCPRLKAEGELKLKANVGDHWKLEDRLLDG
jgi:hypothetical protein